MAVQHRTQHLTHRVGCLLLAEMFLLGYLIEELATRAQLRHDVEETLVLVELVHLDDVRMVQLSQNLHLLPQLIMVLLRSVLLRYNLYSTDRLRHTMQSLTDLPIGTWF
jgi:hypothetical protein